MEYRWAFQRMACLLCGVYMIKQQFRLSFLMAGAGKLPSSPEFVVHQSPSSEQQQDDLKTFSFAACLLVLDDNHRLQEWLSFHYHTLPLRMLIVGVDPRSNESPEPILQLFRTHLNMTIVVWEDKDFNETPDENEYDFNKLRGKYLLRQKTFVRKCMKELSDSGWTWTSLWDTDEYVSYSGFNKTRTNPFHSHLSATSPPDLKQPGSVINYVQAYGEDCYPVNRVYVGAKELSQSIVKNEHHLMDYRRLDTLRFRYRNDYSAKLNGREKVMLNVQHVNHSQDFSSIHRPNAEVCPDRLYGALEDLPMYLNHYVSSWEAYSWRNDSRKGRERSREAYVERAYSTSRHYEDVLTSWLPGFVDNVGVKTARLVLEGAGLSPDFDATDKIADFKCVVGKHCKPVDDSNRYIQPKESFSACLSTVNETSQLSEWISYHYLVLPLRYLVVGLDPRSSEVVEPQLARFRNELNMTIVAWNESDYTKFDPLPLNASLEEVSNRLMARQKIFLKQCMEHLIFAGRTWTALWDSDEFVTLQTNDNLSGDSASIVVQDGEILEYLRREMLDDCIPMMRLAVGTKEMNLSVSDLPESLALSPQQFVTLRYQHRNAFDDNNNGVGKVLLNVQSLDLPIKVNNKHRPVLSCPSPLQHASENSAFYLLQYAGTYEDYATRGDGMTRTYEDWEHRASFSRIHELRARTSISKFISSVGEDKARRLLQNPSFMVIPAF